MKRIAGFLCFFILAVLCLGLDSCNQVPPEVNPEDRLDNPEWACGRWISSNPESADYIEITNKNIIWKISGQGTMNLSEYLKSDYVKIKTRYRFPTQYMYGYKFEDREWFPKLNLMYISLIGTKELSVMFNNPSYTYTFTLAE